jgi:hypothetical protein
VTKIVDPDQLNQATEVVISTAGKTIQLLAAGNLSNSSPGSTSGVTLQALYSFLKEEWKSDNALNKFKFPLQMFTKTDGQFINGWAFADATSRTLVRDAGWTEGSNEYAGIISLGSFDSDTDQAYYANVVGYDQTTTDFDKSGNLNEAILITGFTDYLKPFLRIEAKTYAEYNLLTEQGLTLLEPVLYRLPLANATDLKVSETDTNIDSNSPYTGMKVNYLAGAGFTTAAAQSYSQGDVVQDGAGRWAFCSVAGTLDASGAADYTNNGGTGTFQAYDGEVQIGTSYYAFNRIVDCNNGTAAEAYNWVQRQLRKTSDINADDSPTAGQRSGLTIYGNVAASLGYYLGDQLISGDGVAFTNFNSNSTNVITQTSIEVDGGGIDPVTLLPLGTTPVTYPFTAAGTLEFSANLVSEPDADTRYTMYFTSANGNDFDSANAIIVNDDGGSPIDGQITAASINWDFAYTTNAQGGRTPDTDAAVTVVAQGLNGAQWVLVTYTITKNTGQTISVNASDERNYSNPV